MRIAIDTGGTFTDCVWVQDGRVRILKVFSTPHNPSEAIVEALSRVLGDGEYDAELVLLHGTTVGTNALLERKGARVAFVTTAGFEDSIEIGRQARPRLYDMFFDRVPPLVSPELRFGVKERTDAQGNVLRRPERKEVEKLAQAIQKSGAESVAVSLLFSFASPENERLIAEALREARPELPLSLSHVIHPEFREYERASTVVLNAYLQPMMARYLHSLRERVSEALAHRARIFVMQSSGGIAALDSAAREPVRTVLSGPAGGVRGAAALAARSGFQRIIGFDMGGTSTDVALIDGVAVPTTEGEIAGLPVRVPMLDIHTVGAGGGSLARFDAAGALRVGPESAGADPGPICYGRGTQPTVTDANLILGRLRPEGLLGGGFQLDIERTRLVVQDWLRKQNSNLSVEEFAAGVIRVVNSSMEKAVRVVSIERGFDPREFALVAFGGAGALHACELASALDIPTVIVPPLPGALSAVGILASDVVKDFSRTVLVRAQRQLAVMQELEREVAKLRTRAEEAYAAEGWRGRIRYDASADLRYSGQGYELNVPFNARLLPAFHAEHQRRYGYSHPAREVEIVTVRLRAVLPSQEIALNPEQARRELKPYFSRVLFDVKAARTPVFERDSLRTGRKYAGPAIITEYSATTVVPPGSGFRVDLTGAIVISGELRRNRKGRSA